MKLKDKITLVIPTFNRYEKLFRLLQYYDSFGFPFPIKILDSSTNKKKQQELISLLQNENIEYKEFDCGIRVVEKICMGVSSVQTPFSAICADDDFLVPNGIVQSIKFLEKNSEYSVAQGIYVSFFDNLDKIKGLEWRKTYNIRSIEQKLPSERFYNFLSDYSMTVFYGVYRTEHLNFIWETASRETNDDRFGELLPAMLTATAGKIKALNVLYSARQIDIQSDGNTSLTLRDMIHNRTYYYKFNKFKVCMIANLQKTECISYKNANKIVDKAMDNYLGSITYKIKTFLLLIIEKSFLLNKFYKAFNKSNKKNDFSLFEYENLENPFHSDLIHIEQTIKNNLAL